MQEKDIKKRYRTAALYITLFLLAAIVGVVGAFRIDEVFGFFGYVWDVMLPVTVGFVIAYLLLPAVRFFERKVFVSLKQRGRIRAARASSVILAFSIMFVVVVLISVLLIPQLFSNYTELAMNAEEYIKVAEELADKIIGGSELFGDNSTLSDLLGGIDLEQFLASVIVDSFLLADQFVSSIISFAGSFIDIAMKTVFALISAFGIMLYADKLKAFVTRVLSAFVKEKQITALKNAVAVLDRAFGGFFSGRILESVIIGILALIIFYLARMPYPPLLAVILAVFNLIPYFGSIFAGVLGGVIVFVSEPSMFVWFIVIDLLMEQVDANILAPRVLGDTVGMHPLCIIVSITVMGNILGLAGLLVGVPVAAVFIEAVRYLCKKRELSGIEKKDSQGKRTSESEVSAE
ncbi:MAG: AI-2E family transporter [Clostridia bacterium]|nr:AI-2E family transporter [Clostridia bacterium]